MCLCVCVCTRTCTRVCLYLQYVKQQLQCVLIAALLCLLLFMYFSLPYGSRQLPKCCAPHILSEHTHSLTLAAAVFVQSIVRTHALAHTRLDSRLPLSRSEHALNSGFLLRSLSVDSRLRSVAYEPSSSAQQA